MIVAQYDTDSDVMYVALGSPRPAVTDEQDDGLLFRYDRQSKTPCGVTVLGYAGHWSAHNDQLLARISDFLHNRPDELAAVFRDAVSRSLEPY